MTGDEALLELHDRASRGHTLSEEDKAALAQWYERLDGEEDHRLDQSPPFQSLMQLRLDVEEACAAIRTTSLRIQTLLAENQDLREEVRAVRVQFMVRAASQSAF